MYVSAHSLPATVAHDPHYHHLHSTPLRTPGTHTQKPSSHLNTTHGKWHLRTSHLRQIRRCLNPHTQIPSHPLSQMYLHASTPTSKCILPHTSSNWNLHTSHPAPPGCECPVSYLTATALLLPYACHLHCATSIAPAYSRTPTLCSLAPPCPHTLSPLSPVPHTRPTLAPLPHNM
jgi:hypothetical protein